MSFIKNMFTPSLPKGETERRKEIFLSLSQNLKEVITSEQTAEKLYNISRNNNFDEKKQRILSFTAGEIMLGILKLSEFTNILAKRLEINPEKAEKINQEIKEQIFQPVMNILNKAQEEFLKEKTPSPKPNKESIVNLKEEKPTDEANIVDLKNKEEKKEE